MTRRARRITVGAVGALALLLPLGIAGAGSAQAVTTFHLLTLKNGWTNAPFSTSDAAVANISGIVHLKGAIATGGTNPVPFTLPSADRPATDVFVKVDLCNSANGRLFIQPSGTVTVDAENNFSDAQCFTSLDGVSFAKSATSFTPLTPLNGWTGAPFSTSNPAARTISGVVHLKGAISTAGTNSTAFVLPSSFRPATTVYVPVDMCNATNGRLQINHNGTVIVEPESSFSNAACFTSLDGASYAKSPTSYTPLTLKNGWSGAPFGTSNPEVRTISGIVTLKGAMSTGGTNAVAFTLPSGFRPATAVYVPVDLCNATNGRLFIQPSGTVTVEAEGNTFSNAACFTSLDGASFAP
jgi:hypothetical protein